MKNLNTKKLFNTNLTGIGGYTLIGRYAGLGTLNTSVRLGISLKSRLSNSSRARPSPRCRRFVSPQTALLLNFISDVKATRRHALAASKKAIRNNSTIAGKREGKSFITSLLNELQRVVNTSSDSSVLELQRVIELAAIDEFKSITKSNSNQRIMGIKKRFVSTCCFQTYLKQDCSSVLVI